MSVWVTSLLLSLGSVSGTWVIARGIPGGWLFMLLFQAPLSVYDVATRQYGFLMISALGGWAYFHGWRMARNQHKTVQGEALQASQQTRRPAEPLRRGRTRSPTGGRRA